MCIINFFISHLIFILLSSLFLFAFLNIIVFLPKKKKTNIILIVIDYLYYLAKKILFFSIIIFFVYFLLGILNFVSFIPLASLSKLELDKSMELVFSACITSIGVFAGFYFNKKQTYKEIVTRERIEWLHKLQNNLSEYLKLTRKGRIEEENQENVSQLFYKIIFAINHDKDREALNAIRKYNDYLKFQGICYDKYQNAVNKRIYSVYVDKDPSSPDDYNKYDVEIMKLQHFDLLREDVESKFVEIFKSVWEDVKGEAD